MIYGDRRLGDPPGKTGGARFDDLTEPQSAPRSPGDSTARAFFRYAVALLLAIAIFMAGYILPNGKEFAAPFLRWMATLREVGLADVIPHVQDQYGPLTYVLLAYANLTEDVFRVTPYDAFKFVQLQLLVASVVVAGVLTRDFRLMQVFAVLLATPSFVFASIDIYFTPSALIGIWALAHRRHALFSLAFTAACLTKYQPVIFGPIVVACVLRRAAIAWRASPRTGASVLAASALPGVAMVAAVTAVFSTSWLITASEAIEGHTRYASGGALNVHWLFGFLSQATDGTLAAAGGLIAIQSTTDVDVLASRVVLFAVTVALAWLYLRREDSPLALYTFCALVLLSYYQLATNVHINHLHAVLIPLVLLAAVVRAGMGTLVFWGMVLTVNLLMFFAFPQSRLVFGFDLTLALTLLTLAAYGAMLWTSIQRTQPFSGRAEARADRAALPLG